jgi:hypothetical protein
VTKACRLPKTGRLDLRAAPFYFNEKKGGDVDYCREKSDPRT